MSSRKIAAARTSPKPARSRVAESATPGEGVARKSSRRAKPAAKPAPAVPADKPSSGRDKLVRDSFTMPQADFDLVARLKARALEFKRPTKKSELLRAGLQVLNRLDDKALESALGALTPLKPGRPKKSA